MDEKWRAWRKDVLLPLIEHTADAERSPQLQALLKRDPVEVDLALLAADTDRTQEYVFESAKLPEIRRGSELLRKLNEDEIPGIIRATGLPDDKCILFAAGGSILAIVPASVIAELVKQIEQLYPNETGKATITCVSQRVTPQQLLHGVSGDTLSLQDLNALKDKPQVKNWQRLAQNYGATNGDTISEQAFQQNQRFGQMVQVMGTLLRQRKDGPLTKPTVETLPFAMRCKVCQIRPAERMYRYFEEEAWPLCDVCRRKVTPGIGGAKETRSQQLKRFLDKLNNNWPELETRYLAGISPTRIYHPQDLNELGEVCRLQMGNGYVGFIYADGNRMGRILESLSTPKDYKTFSSALKTTIRNAAYKALAENLHPTLIERISPTNKPLGRGYIHPVEPLVMGGDDVVLIVPGNEALPIAARLCQHFEREMKHRVPDEVWNSLPETLRQPTLSAGIVIADSHNPVRVLQQLSKELCRIAKRRAYDEELNNGSATATLDFLLLKSQSMVRHNVRQLRQTPPYFYPEEDETGRYLTAAPYRLDEFCRLLELLKLMRQADFPISQLRNLVASLHKGRNYGSVHYLYQKVRFEARLGAGQQSKNVLTKLSEIWSYDPQRDPIPWHQAPGEEEGVFASILPDLLELYPLVPRFTGLNPKAREAALSSLWQEILVEASDEHQN